MSTGVLSTTRLDTYQAITNQIVAAIEAGAGEYVMPWNCSGPAAGRPVNACTRYRYRGVNVVSLWAAAVSAGYRSGHWATYEQWKRVGGQVRKGERGSPIVFYKPIEAPEPDADGMVERAAPRLLARTSIVFNRQQVDGWSPPEEEPMPLEGALDQAEGFVRATGALIRVGSDYAAYSLKEDLILMPHLEDFRGSRTSTALETYYATLFHELVHWTGAPWRLKRTFGERFGDEAYAMEELVAEIGAAFLCADLEIASEPRTDHAAYVANWLRVLKGDKRAIFTAAKAASDAAAYLGTSLPVSGDE